MEPVISGELIYFLNSIVLGVICGVIFDVFKIARLTVKHGVLAVFFEDLIFFGLISIMTYDFMLKITNGQVRFFIIIGEIIGFIIYQLTVSRVIVKIITKINLTVIKFFRFNINYIIKPILRFSYRVIEFIFNPIKRQIIKMLKWSKKHLKNIFVIVYNFIGNKMIKKIIKRVKNINN